MPSEWTVETIKAHIDSLLAEHQHSHDVQHQAQQRALDAAFAASEKAVRAALDTQQRATDAAFLAQAAAVSAALASQERQSTAVNDAQDERLESMKKHFSEIQAEHRRSHEESHITDARAIQAALQAQKDANAAALAAQKEAIIKSEAADVARFASVNEFRATLSDQQRTLMPRAESLALHAATQEKIEAAAANRLLMMPRAEAIASIAAMQEKIDSLTQRIDRGEGRGSGLQAGWGYLVGAVGLASAIIGIAIVLLR